MRFLVCLVIAAVVVAVIAAGVVAAGWAFRNTPAPARQYRDVITAAAWPALPATSTERGN